MFIKLKSGAMLNLYWLQDCFQGKHDKSIVIFYLVNGVKLIENYDTEQEATDRVADVDKLMDKAGIGGGLVQKDSYSDFPTEGSTGFIYIAKDTGATYYWDEATSTYISVGTSGRTGVYSVAQPLPSAVGTTTTLNKSDLIEILKPTVDFSEGSEVIGDNSVHGIIVSSTSTTVDVKTITDLTIDSFQQVDTINDLPVTGKDNILYFVKDIKSFKVWDGTAYIDPEGGKANLTEDITSNVTCGAAPAGTLFPKGLSFTEFAKMILVKEIAPTITVNATDSGVHLVNDAVNGTAITLKINSLGTATPSTIEFYVNNTLIDTQNYATGQMTYTTNYATSIQVNTTVMAKLIFSKSTGDSSSVSATKTFTFVNPSYIGTTSLDSTSITDTDIKNMTILKLTNKSYTATGLTMTDERIVFAYPQSYGNLSSIKDANNFEYIQSYTNTNITIDNITYNVYVLTDPVTVINFKQTYN